MKNVLLIDDDDRIRKSLHVWFLESIKDAEVFLASNLKEARSWLKDKKMDLIISDYDLGSEKGTQLFDTNANDQFSCPVIFLTGQGNKEVMKEIANKQVFKVLEKGTMLFSDIEPIIHEAFARKQVDQQKKKISFIGENTATLIHEINNPLTVILGKTQMLEKKLEEKYPDFKDDEYLQKSFKAIKDSTNRLLSLMQNTKGVINDKESDLNLKVISIKQLLSNFLDLNQELILKENVTVKTEIDADFEMKIDVNNFYQILGNLFNNAIDALNEYNITKKMVTINAKSIGTLFNEITFEDNGPGIPKEIREKVFQSLFTTKQGNKGTGLGLSICKDIINKHLGELYLDPSTDKARFVIKIPSNH